MWTEDFISKGCNGGGLLPPRRSRSVISCPRHELYRRVLCNDPGGLVERGEYFSSEEELKKTIQNVCFHNVNVFLGFGVTI